MARKDLPYLPLYVQDFLTDEKLMECSASATGVYIRVMCVLHKCDPYGKILLKQKDKQSSKQLLNFASKFAKHFPYDLPTILSGLEELISEDCLQIDGDFLIQKRMFEDGNLSLTRSKSGSEGGKVTQKNKHEFAKAKNKANTDIDIDIENKEKNRGVGKGKGFNTMPKPEDVNGLPEVKIQSAIEQMKITQQTDIDKKDVLGMWEVFKPQKLTGNKFYADEDAVQDYFLNWIKTQKFKPKNGKSNYQEQVKDAIKNFEYVKET